MADNIKNIIFEELHFKHLADEPSEQFALFLGHEIASKYPDYDWALNQ